MERYPLLIKNPLVARHISCFSLVQRVLLEKKTEFFDEDSEVPNVPALVMELMLNIFISTYNHKDEEGRCFRFVPVFSLVEL